MSILDLFRQPDINNGVNNFKSSEDAVLLDVRTREEYSEGHIPNSINVPLCEINRIAETIKEQDKKIFLYCRSGNRSGQATMLLLRKGYQNVENIGGIKDYKGEISKISTMD